MSPERIGRDRQVVSNELRALVLELVERLEARGYPRSDTALMIAVGMLSLGTVLALGNGISPDGMRETVEQMLAEWEAGS